MMSLTQYLLSKLAEESAEFSKEVLKGQQQGLFSEHRGKKNYEYIQDEFIDIIARSTLLNACNDVLDAVGENFDLLINRHSFNREINLKMQASIDKMCYYAVMARDGGHLQLTEKEEGLIVFYHNQHLATLNRHRT